MEESPFKNLPLDDKFQARKSNAVRNLLVIGGLIYAIGFLGLGIGLSISSGIDQSILNLFTLGGGYPNLAIVAVALAAIALVAICITIALGIAINEKIQSKTLKSLVNFVLFLALGMGSVALLAFMFGITVPTLLAGFVDLGSVFGQGEIAQAVLTGSIFAVILVSLVIGFGTYKSGLDYLPENEENSSLTVEGSIKQSKDLIIAGPRTTYNVNCDVFELQNDTGVLYKYVLDDELHRKLPAEFYSRSIDLKKVNEKDLLRAKKDTEFFVKEYTPEPAKVVIKFYQENQAPPLKAVYVVSNIWGGEIFEYVFQRSRSIFSKYNFPKKFNSYSKELENIRCKDAEENFLVQEYDPHKIRRASVANKKDSLRPSGGQSCQKVVGPNGGGLGNRQ